MISVICGHKHVVSSSQEPLNWDFPAFITYLFSGNCEGVVADLHCVRVSIELNLH